MSTPPNAPTPGPQPHSHLLLNRVVTAVLRSPLHPLLSRNLLPLTYRLAATESHGVLIRWAGSYDPLVRMAFAGREARIRAELLDQLALRSGDRVLDVACGTGTLAVAAAARVGPEGWVGALDASPGMVQAARRKAARTGVRMDVREGLAQALPFPDASVDAVVSTLAWHHIPPGARSAAAAEMARVLRPGGRLLIADFQAPANSLARGLTAHLLGHRMAGNETAAVADLMTTAGFVTQRRGTTSARWLAFVTARKPTPDTAATPAR